MARSPEKRLFTEWINRRGLEALGDQQIRRYAQGLNIATNGLTAIQILDILFADRPVLRFLKRDRSFRKALLEGGILNRMGARASERRIDEKSSDRRIDPHRELIAQRARLAQSGPSGNAPRASSGITIAMAGRGLLPPDASRRLKRSASHFNVFNRNVETIPEEGPSATTVSYTPTPENQGEDHDDSRQLEEQIGEVAEGVAEDSTEEYEDAVPENEARDKSPENFPIDRYPSPVDGDSDGEEPAADTVPEFTETFTDGPLTFTFPPSAPFSPSDPDSVLKMLDVVKEQRAEILKQLAAARNELGQAMLDANLARAELDEERTQIQSLVDGLAKVVGKKLIREIIEDADHFVKNGFNWDEWEALCCDEGDWDDADEIEDEQQNNTSGSGDDDDDDFDHDDEDYRSSALDKDSPPRDHVNNESPPHRTKRSRDIEDDAEPPIAESRHIKRPKHHQHPSPLKRTRDPSDNEDEDDGYIDPKGKGKEKAVDNERIEAGKFKRIRLDRRTPSSPSPSAISAGKRRATASLPETDGYLDLSSSEEEEEEKWFPAPRIRKDTSGAGPSCIRHAPSPTPEPSTNDPASESRPKPRGRPLHRAEEVIVGSSAGQFTILQTPQSNECQSGPKDVRYNPETEEYELYYTETGLACNPKPIQMHDYDTDLYRIKQLSGWQYDHRV